MNKTLMVIIDLFYESYHRLLDLFYTFFGTDEYLKEREPTLLFDKWICNSVEWQLFYTHKEAMAAIKESGPKIEKNQKLRQKAHGCCLQTNDTSG